MSIASNTRRPHIGGSARIARDSDETPVNYDTLIRELIERVPEADRARYAELLLGDRNALADRVTTAQDAAEARFERAHALAVAGRLDEFAAVAAGLPDHNRLGPPASPARCRAPVASGPYAAADRVMAREAAAAAVSEASVLFPNMNRLAGGR